MVIVVVDFDWKTCEMPRGAALLLSVLWFCLWLVRKGFFFWGERGGGNVPFTEIDVRDSNVSVLVESEKRLGLT